MTGIGPTDQIAQNGIELGFGATGSINGNQVSNLIYTPASVGSSGILLFGIDSGAALSIPAINNNTVSNAQYGIVLDGVEGTPTSTLPIIGNNVSGAAFAGIGLYSDPSEGLNNDYIRVSKNTVSGTNPYDNIDVCSDNNTILRNTISDAAEGGIHLDGLCQELDNSSTGVNNLVSGNQITDNCVGILSGPAVGMNTIRRNTFSGNTNNYEYGTDSWSCSARHHGASKRLMPRAPVQPLRP